MGKDYIKFKIEGLDEVKRMLDSIPKTINDKISYDINRAAAKIAKDQLAADAPEGDNNSKSEDKAANNVVIAKNKDQKTAVLVGFARRVFYILLNERGTKLRTTKKRGERGSIDRKPFIQESHNKAYPRIIDYLTTNYLKLMHRAIKKQAKRIQRANKKGR